MAEPTSTTERTDSAADAPPPDEATERAEARAPSTDTSGDGTAPLTIEPNAVIETSGAVSERPRAASARASAGFPPSKTDRVDGAKPLAAYELLARSARLADLVALTNRIVTDAAQTRAADWSFASKVAAAAEEAKLTHEDADTTFGNVLDVLANGGEGAAERALAAALWAHAVAETPRSRTEDEDRLAGDILWLATHTSFDATPLIDRALGEDAAELWSAIADRIRRIDRDRGGALGRGEAIFGCAALAASDAVNAEALCHSLANELKDPVLVRVLTTRGTTVRDVSFEGEWAGAPRGLVKTTLLACTGLLFIAHAVRLFARAALAYRRPAEVSLSDAGVKVKTRTVMLGRTLREREHVIVKAGLVRVVREVRFPRLAFYAGLLALALGSYVGVRTFVDGVRAASPSLLLVGLVVVAIGVGLDFVLGSLVPGVRGQCRVAFVPRTGPTLCIAEISTREADDAVARYFPRR